MMRWLGISLFLCLIFLPSICRGDDYSDSQLNKGIRNSEAYSYVLIGKAHEDNANEVELLKKALLYSPDLPAVYFELSKAVFSLSGPGILKSVDYAILGLDAYSRNSWWTFTLLGSMFINLIFSFAIATAMVVVVRLFTDIPLITHDIEETNSRGLIFFMIMVLSLASPLLFLGGILILLGLYMKRCDRFTVYLFLFFLVIYPLFSTAAARYVSALSSGDLKAIVKVNDGEGNDYAISVLKKGGDYPSLYSYALALKRDGRYDEAINVYKGMLDKKKDPRIYVNLGNCYVGLYNFEEGKKSVLREAINAYTSAVDMKPLPSAYYNLSQVSREMLDFAAGEEYFESALALDRVAVSGYRAIAGRNANRFVIDETLTPAEMWNAGNWKNGGSSLQGVAAVPPSAVSLAGIILFATFYFLDSLWHQRAFRCRKCGTILCFKCEKTLMWGEMCSQCYRSLVKLDELDVKERVSWLLGIYEKQRKHRETIKVLSFVLPGLSFVYAGRVLAGFLFLWVFLFFLLLPVTLWMFVPDSQIVSHHFFRWASLYISAVLYLIIHYITRKRVAKGWL